MNLLFVSQEYPPETAHGGIATQTRAKALGMAQRGHEVTVLSASTTGRRTEANDGPVRVVRVPPPDHRLPMRSAGARTIAWSVEVAAAIEELRAAAPYDVVEFAEYGAEGFFWLANRDPGSSPRAVVTVHGPTRLLSATLGWPEPGSFTARLQIQLEEHALALADATCASSAWSADFVAAACGIDRSRLPVLHTGVDTGHFAPRPRPAGTRSPTVLFVGKLARSKGADVLGRAALRAAGRIPGLRVRFVGRAHEPHLESELRAYAACADRRDVFEFCGAVPHESLPDECARADVFAAPSPCEGGPGFAWLEAMACGLPAIACAGTGAAESVLDGETGTLVPPGDVDALAAALVALFADDDRRAAMSRRARDHVLATASRPRCLDRIEAWLQAVADGSTAIPTAPA